MSSSTSHRDPSSPSSDAVTPDTSAAVAIQSGMEDLLVSVLERDFLVPATWITVVDVSKCQVVIDGRRFRLDSPYSDGRPCLRLLDAAGRRSLEMPTATSPRQLAAILLSPPPGPVSLRRESVRWVVATITVVACLWYLTRLLADVWGTDKAASTWQMLVIPLLLLPNYLVHESAITTVRRAARWLRRRGCRPPLDRSVGDGAAAAADREVQ